MSISETKLESARLLEWLRQTEARGRALKQVIPAAKIYVGVCGTEVAFDEFRFSNGLGFIRKVVNPPGSVHVLRAANLANADYLAVSRYSSSIRAELAPGLESDSDIDSLLDVAFHTAALIKLRHHPNLTCPCFATASWDVVSAITDNTVNFGMLDDVPRQVRGAELEAVTEEEMRWVDRIWLIALGLRSVERSRRFGLAFNVSYVWNQTSDMRLALASLWCGIEALFGDKRDRPVTRRVIEKICDWLPVLNADEVEDSYNRRCDAVHGRWVENDIIEVVLKADEILRQALLRCIELDKTPLPDWAPES